ncbi:MAG: pimeloyl-ACP methyl ester carboxylesterase [Candidatus Azotimanducaceae bacterium]|jgi:pimeloyl-ACP methyl ester carboxylesterase
MMDSSVSQVTVPLPGRAGDPDFHLKTYMSGTGPAVVFVHGFPDLALGWQNQLPVVAAAGFRVIAPDMRGYGGSSCPADVDQYSLAELTGDLAALLDALDIDRAVFVGHDWGGFVTWGMAVLHPDRVVGIAAACTPYMPFPSLAKHLAVVDGEIDRQYVAWFQEPGVAEAHMQDHVGTIVTNIMRSSVPLREVYEAALQQDGKISMNPFLNPKPDGGTGKLLLDDESYAHYVKCFTETGFRGGINWYRNIDQNAESHPEVGVKPLDIPCLMLTAEWDPGLRPAFAADMPERCSQLEIHLVEKSGHWMQQEHADLFNRYLLGWLENVQQ